MKSDWYQLGSETVVVVLYGKNLKECNFNVKVENSRLTVLNPDKSIAYETALCHPVIADEMKIHYSVPKMEISLKKQDSSINWPSLAPASTASEKQQNSSEKWKEISQEKEDEEETSGNVDAFFKSIYANSDENTRKAMIKSFTESGGTCLSTNWEDVSKKKVEYHSSSSNENK